MGWNSNIRKEKNDWKDENIQIRKNWKWSKQKGLKIAKLERTENDKIGKSWKQRDWKGLKTITINKIEIVEAMKSWK